MVSGLLNMKEEWHLEQRSYDASCHEGGCEALQGSRKIVGAPTRCQSYPYYLVG